MEFLYLVAVPSPQLRTEELQLPSLIWQLLPPSLPTSSLSGCFKNSWCENIALTHMSYFP